MNFMDHLGGGGGSGGGGGGGGGGGCVTGEGGGCSICCDGDDCSGNGDGVSSLHLVLAGAETCNPLTGVHPSTPDGLLISRLK